MPQVGLFFFFWKCRILLQCIDKVFQLSSLADWSILTCVKCPPFVIKLLRDQDYSVLPNRLKICTVLTNFNTASESIKCFKWNCAGISICDNWTTLSIIFRKHGHNFLYLLSLTLLSPSKDKNEWLSPFISFSSTRRWFFINNNF